MTATSDAATSDDGKKDGLLPPRRVSNIYDSHVQASTQGETSVRILAFAAGMGLVACALMVLVHWIGSHRFSWLEFPIFIASLVVGAFALALESNVSFMQAARMKITGKAPGLGQVKGRGAMYTVVGLLQCAMLDPLDILVGLFTAAVGVYMIRVGHKAAASLSALKLAITDEAALLDAFHIHDRNGDGVLEMFEFDGLIYSLGVELDSDELDAAFSSIDTNNDKKIAFDEFRSWWKACTTDSCTEA